MDKVRLFWLLLLSYYSLYMLILFFLDFSIIITIIYFILPLFILIIKLVKEKKNTTVLPVIREINNSIYIEIIYPSNKVDILIGHEKLLPLQLYNCCICTEDYFNTEFDSIKLECGHIHHKKCITEWIEIANTCPICRATIYNSYIYNKNI